MSNLLDKASILLSPTAYNNGSMLSVKPTDGDGDFTFVRGSAATRVNAQGLVENVQIINGELVINGDFATDSNWDKRGSETTISGGKCNFNWVGNNYILIQYDIIEVGKTYKLTYEIVSYTSGKIYANVGGNLNFREAVGVYTEHFTPTTTNLAFRSNSGFIGSIDNVSVKELTDDTNLPRINYEGFSYDGNGDIIPDSGCGSWLLEPQSTNLVPYSEDFSQWVGVNSVIVALTTEISAPNGLLSSVYKITSGNVSSRIQVSSITSASNYTKSIFVKHSTNTTLRFDGSGSNNRVEFSITSSGVTLSSAASNVISTNIEDYGNGWFRISATLPAASDFFQINPDVSGNDNGSVYIWGAQLEEQTHSTSYIPTSGATNTRNQDIATNSGNATLINSTEGVLYAEVSALANYNSQRLVSLSDGTTSNTVKIGFLTSATNYTIVSEVRSEAVLSAYMTYSFGSISPIMTKIAIKYKENDFSLYVNGSEVATSNIGSTSIGLSELSFDRGGGGQKFEGKAKALAVYKEALTDAELQSLTTI